MRMSTNRKERHSISPNRIDTLAQDEIFVFGSNIVGLLCLWLFKYDLLLFTASGVTNNINYNPYDHANQK